MVRQAHHERNTPAPVRPEPVEGRANPLRWFVLSALVIVLDQMTKAWIVEALQPGSGVALTGFFNLVHVYNDGAAFSFLRGAGGWQRWVFTLLALGISAWLVMTIRQHARERLLPFALSLVLGGALGNLIDRIRMGAVIDFLDAHWGGAHFPAFNVADSAITIGVVLLLWQQIFVTKKT